MPQHEIDSDILASATKIGEAAAHAGGPNALNYPDKVVALIEMVAHKLQELRDAGQPRR